MMKSSNNKAARNTAMDLVRCIALLTVVSVHFFMNSGFYSQPVMGKRMFVMTVARTGFMVCVPLFLVLSGYLMCGKTVSRKYYGGITKTLGIYVLASISCLIFKKVYLGMDITLETAFWATLNFSGANYSWYIEMYIGLFLLIPFLNILYRNIDTQKNKQILLITFLVLTALPSVVNIYNFQVSGWWGNPALSTAYNKIMPSWWQGGIFPLTYYFIGCYLREYPFKMKKSTRIVLLLCSVIVFGTFNYYRSYGVPFVSGDYQSWCALPNVVMTVLLFSILSDISFQGCPHWCSTLLARLSGCCLGGYLVSFIFDNMFYSILNTAVPDVLKRMPYFVVMVPLVYVCSLAFSYVLNLIYQGMQVCVRATVRSVSSQN